MINEEVIGPRRHDRVRRPLPRAPQFVSTARQRASAFAAFEFTCAPSSGVTPRLQVVSGHSGTTCATPPCVVRRPVVMIEYIHADGDVAAEHDPAAAATWALDDELVQLRQAAVSRAQVGVVKGLLAGRYSCSTGQAWSLLVRISQTTNIKVRDVADALQRSFDGHALTEQQAQTLATVLLQLPSGSWPPDHISRCR